MRRYACGRSSLTLVSRTNSSIRLNTGKFYGAAPLELNCNHFRSRLTDFHIVTRSKPEIGRGRPLAS
jgi:hypothetical protein